MAKRQFALFGEVPSFDVRRMFSKEWDCPQERIMHELWVEANEVEDIYDAPVVDILSGALNCCFSNPNSFLDLREGERRIVAGVVQFFSTPEGLSFYKTTVLEKGKMLTLLTLEQEHILSTDLLRRHWNGVYHVYQSPSSQQMKILEAILCWLSSGRGRGFFEEFKTRIEQIVPQIPMASEDIPKNGGMQ